MEIIPRPNFRDARSIPARFSRFDPRADGFREREVIVNLRECTVIHPPAVMWCAVYLLLAKRRGSDCMLIAPENPDVAANLADLGLPEVLQRAGVTVDLEVGSASNSQGTSSIDGVRKHHRSRRLDQPDSSFLDGVRVQGTASVNHVVYETFSELANNAAEHSTSEIGAYGLVSLDTSQDGTRLMCGVADGGVGIQTSLLRNPLHEEYGHFEWSAMDRATEELVSGTLDSYRGIGLYETVEKARSLGRELIIHSGTGIINKLARGKQGRLPVPGYFPVQWFISLSQLERVDNDRRPYRLLNHFAQAHLDISPVC